MLSEEFAIQKVREIYDKYRDDPYMYLKTHNYICIQLPTMLEAIKKTHDERDQRNKQLTADQTQFIQMFLQRHQYFYCQTTEYFFHYDGEQYTVCSEDEILHHILTTITAEYPQLMPRKPQTKVYIMKRIKDCAITHAVPDTSTIQNVLDYIYPSLFKSKAEAKYFLAVVGDNILKKYSANGSLPQHIHLINHGMKPFLTNLANYAQIYFGANAVGSFKYKYYEHDYTNCRLIDTNIAMLRSHSWEQTIKTNALNLLCVACHYSNRFENADMYLEYFANDEGVARRALLLKNNTPEYIVDEFISEYITLHPRRDSGDDNIIQIAWVNMPYLWRRFLDGRLLPNIILQPTLKKIMIDKLREYYDDTNDTFYGIYSKYLPVVQKFLQFWNGTITVMTEPDPLAEYEVDEICQLYKYWVSTAPSSNSLGGQQPDATNMMVSIHKGKTSGTYALTEVQILDIIRSYFPEIEIDETEKYVYNIRCSLWDKTADIQAALNLLTEEGKTVSIVDASNVDIGETIGVYDAYIWYSNYMATACRRKLAVSKLYFEKYLQETQQ